MSNDIAVGLYRVTHRTQEFDCPDRALNRKAKPQEKTCRYQQEPSEDRQGATGRK